MTEGATASSEPVPDREAKRNFRSVCVALTCAFLVHSMLLVTVPVYALEMVSSARMLGVIFSAPYLLPLLFAIPLGGLVARWGGRLPMTAGAALMIGGLLVMIGVQGVAGLIAGQLLVGLGQLLMVLSAQTVISGLATGKALESYFGWYTTWLSGGQVVGPLLAGALIDLGRGVTPAFLVMTVIAAVGAMVALTLVGQAACGTRVDRSVTGYRAQGRLLVTSRGVQISVAVSVAAMFAMSVHGSYLPVYLKELSVSASTIGILVSLRAIASMLIRPFIARVISFLGGRELAMLLSLALLAVGLLFLGVTGNVMIIAVLSVFIGLGSGVSQPLSIVILAENVNSAQRPGALGMRLMANRGINFLAPLLFGLMLEAGGFVLAFPMAGLVLAISGYLLFRFLKRVRYGQ